jgi:hypothetical protein
LRLSGVENLEAGGFDVVNLDGGYKSILEGGFNAFQTLQETAVMQRVALYNINSIFIRLLKVC